MTVGGYIGFGFIVLFAVSVIAAVCGSDLEIISKILLSILMLALCVGARFGLKWYFNDTESGKRAMKDQESNFSGGIERTVDIYDMEGDLIKSYSGEFDVETHDTNIVFDDENGKRHIVYFTTGTVVIDEK